MRGNLLARDSETGWFNVFIGHNEIGIFEYFKDIKHFIHDEGIVPVKMKKFKSFRDAHHFIFKYIPKDRYPEFGLDKGYLRVNTLYKSKTAYKNYIIYIK